VRIIFLLILALVWGGLFVVVKKAATQNPAQTRAISRYGPFAAELIGAAGLLALATIGFFWQILFTPNTWMPAGGGDLAPFLYPNYRFAAEHLRQGVIPLWNPHLYSGAPFAADIQSGLFYPVNLALFLLVPTLTYEWLEYLALFHFWLAGTSMYACLRLLNIQPAKMQVDPHPSDSSISPPFITPPAAFAGALAFQFSDLFIVHFGNLNMIAVAAWLPLVFLLFHLSLTRSSPGLAAAAGVVLAVATLAGHIQITLFILLALALYTLWHWRFWILDFGFWVLGSLPDTRKTPPKPLFTRPNFRPVLPLLITLIITVGLSALLLLPAYQMSQYTPRAQLPYQEAARFSLHPAQMAGLLVPNYFGRDPALHWGPWERVETGYIGIMPLLLAIVGAALDRSKLKGYFLGLGLIALLLALGGYSVLHGWLYAAVPGFGQLRAPARFILLLDFSLAALAALGLNRLLHPLDAATQSRLSTLLKPLTWGLGGLIVVAAPLSYFAMLVTQDRNPAIFNRAGGAAAGVATFAIFAIAALIVLHLVHKKWLPQAGVGIAAIVLIGLDLFTLGYNVDVGHTNPTAGFHHPAAQTFLQNDPNHYRLEVTTDVWHAWQPNAALLYREYDAWGLYNPLTLADTTRYWSSAPPRSSGRYNFLGIKYIIASKAGAPADGNIVPVFEGDPQINIYLNQDALAPVQFVGQTTVVPSHGAAWEAIHAEGFDPSQTVVLEGGQPLDTTPDYSLSLLQYSLHAVTVAVETDQPGYLVLPDAYYPGWQATVGGQSTPVWRANYAFRAVYVPAGQHTVQFQFDPVIWKVGLALSGATLLGLAGWAGWRWRRRQIP